MALIRRDDAALVYSRDVFTSWALCVAGADNLRLIFEAHAPPETRTRRWLLGRVLMNRRFLRLVAISRALADEFRRLYPGLGDDRIIVAHDGASEPLPAERIEAAFRDSSRTSVGYVGSLRPGKGMEIIHALAPLLPQCDFHVVGGDEGAVRDWKQRTSSPNVTFHGFVSPAEAQRRMKDFDVVLAPYQPVVLVGDGDLDIGRWMSPLKLFEYMSHGKPILASDLPVLREVLKDGNNALLADPLDVTDWGRKLAQLAGDAALRARLGAAALRDLRGNYTWDRRAASILDKAGVTEGRVGHAGPT
jgi:glycosyltransferase involved in cell wall biosynthesis